MQYVWLLSENGWDTCEHLGVFSSIEAGIRRAEAMAGRTLEAQDRTETHWWSGNYILDRFALDEEPA